MSVGHMTELTLHLPCIFNWPQYWFGEKPQKYIHIWHEVILGVYVWITGQGIVFLTRPSLLNLIFGVYLPRR